MDEGLILAVTLALIIGFLLCVIFGNIYGVFVAAAMVFCLSIILDEAAL